jgi:hypothetical protein
MSLIGFLPKAVVVSDKDHADAPAGSPERRHAQE